MRTTIDIPDELFRAVKAKAALEGRTMKAMMLEGLQLVMQKAPSRKRRLRKTRFPIIEGGQDGRMLTSEQVQKAIDDYYEEEAGYHAQFMRH
jgi:hypothetical protein